MPIRRRFSSTAAHILGSANRRSFYAKRTSQKFPGNYRERTIQVIRDDSVLKFASVAIKTRSTRRAVEWSRLVPTRSYRTSCSPGSTAGSFPMIVKRIFDWLAYVPTLFIFYKSAMKKVTWSRTTTFLSSKTSEAKAATADRKATIPDGKTDNEFFTRCTCSS